MWQILNKQKSDIKTFTDVSRETWGKLTTLYEWHQKCSQYGSFAKYKSEDDFFQRHVFNSMHLLPHIKQGDVILDIGSGGGFPGLILAAAGHNVILSELNPKKRFFLAEAARLMQISPYIIRDSRYCDKDFTVVSARAVSSLVKLFQLVPCVSRETRGLFLKGKNYKEEIEECKGIANFSHKVHSYKEGVVLEVTWHT